MASKTCSLRLRMLQWHTRSLPQKRLGAVGLAPRSFATTSLRHEQHTGPNATATTSIPPVTPELSKGGSAAPTSTKAAAELWKIAGNATETYTAFGTTELLYKECSRQADYSMPQASQQNEDIPVTADGEHLGVGSGGWWHNELGLKPTFSTWSQVTMLHLYLISARFRCFSPQTSKTWQQHFIDHFFYDAENRMMKYHNMHARGTRNKYLQDLFMQWRGLLAAYDEGCVKGDAVLAAAVWRNVFNAREDVDLKSLAEIVSYMRRALQGLDSVSDEKVMQADLKFGSPTSETQIVSLRSPMMDLPFAKASGSDLPETKQP